MKAKEEETLGDEEENVEFKKKDDEKVQIQKDVCGNCKKDLKRSDNLRRHVKSVHEGDEEGCSEMAKEKVEEKEKN